MAIDSKIHDEYKRLSSLVQKNDQMIAERSRSANLSRAAQIKAHALFMLVFLPLMLIPFKFAQELHFEIYNDQALRGYLFLAELFFGVVAFNMLILTGLSISRVMRAHGKLAKIMIAIASFSILFLIELVYSIGEKGVLDSANAPIAYFIVPSVWLIYLVFYRKKAK